MKYEVLLVRPDLVSEDAHGNPIRRPRPPVPVPAAGWSEPTAEAMDRWRDIDHVSFDVELHADAGRIKPTDRVIVAGVEYRVIGRSNYDNGPFDFTPGLDILRLHNEKG